MPDTIPTCAELEVSPEEYEKEILTIKSTGVSCIRLPNGLYTCNVKYKGSMPSSVRTERLAQEFYHVYTKSDDISVSIDSLGRIDFNSKTKPDEEVVTAVVKKTTCMDHNNKVVDVFRLEVK